jgi:hypothetical protein
MCLLLGFFAISSGDGFVWLAHPLLFVARQRRQLLRCAHEIKVLPGGAALPDFSPCTMTA